MGALVDPKDPDVDQTYELDLWQLLVQEVRLSYRYGLGELVRAQRDTGYFYVCNKAGRTPLNYPDRWPNAAGEVIKHGSLNWRSVDPSDAVLPTIQPVVWTPEDGITVASQQQTLDRAFVTLSGGLDGEQYDVTARIVMSEGGTVDHTITVPVQQQ